MVGSLINKSFGWRYPLITIAVLSVATLVMMFFALPETRDERTAWNIRSIKNDYITLLTNKEFMLLTMGPSVLVSVYLTFVATASFFYQRQLGLSIIEFAVHQGFVLASFALVSVFTGKINHFFGMKKSIQHGNWLAVLGALVLLYLGLCPMAYPYSITFFMCLHVMGIALSFGTTVAIAFNVVPDLAGASSSLIMASRLFFSSAMVAYASEAYDGTWLSVSRILVIGALIGCFLIAQGLKASKSNLLTD
jgi:DHA1 family bicyclomycin/chloramphenicol resistance-like MFS transporter